LQALSSDAEVGEMTGRSIASILLDLEQTVVARDAAIGRYSAANGTEEDHAEYSKLDDKLDDLRDEFRARFKELTGEQWSNVEAATMSGAL
jgi:hypothetical protein